MKTIHKYKIMESEWNVAMPKGAAILCVNEQHGEVCVWAEVDVNQPEEVRSFRVFGTGRKIPCEMGINLKYIGTAFLEGGALVLHIYEVTI